MTKDLVQSNYLKCTSIKKFLFKNQSSEKFQCRQKAKVDFLRCVVVVFIVFIVFMMSERNILASGHDGTKRNKFFFGWLKIKKSKCKSHPSVLCKSKIFRLFFQEWKINFKVKQCLIIVFWLKLLMSKKEERLENTFCVFASVSK